MKSATHPDSTAAAYNYAGSSTESIDEMGIARITETDGLGRLGFVCEEATANLQFGADKNYTSCVQDTSQSLPQRTGFNTSYQYDVLDDPVDVHQGNSLPDRQFTYDSLSRLLTASNPESGATLYSYDPNGNLSARARPAPNQANPAATVTTTYAYDSPNRVTRKTYSDGVTPEVDFVYDQASAGMGGVLSLANTIGRLAYAFSPGSVMDIYSYDLMGRTTDLWQCVTSTYTSGWHAQHTYDLAGDLLSTGYNGAATRNYSYDSSQRLVGVGGTGTGLPSLPATLLSNVSFDSNYPLGMHQGTLGNNLTETRGYSSRTWLNSLVAS